MGNRTIDRDSQAWRAAWALLKERLRKTKLPTIKGRTVPCTINDFMLMKGDHRGNFYFKHRVTRTYLIVKSR